MRRSTAEPRNAPEPHDGSSRRREPRSRAALAGLGLLDDALALDLRRPQDYFERVWNIGFRATELVSTSADTGPGCDGQPDAYSDESGELEATA